MVEVALYEPEIPPNTGNIIRLCANTGTQLHLIHPLGFELDEKRVRRAGLDYNTMASVAQHADFATFLEVSKDRRIWSVSTRGDQVYSDARFESDDILLFGPETRGLPQHWLSQQASDQVLRLPMQAESRSLNLSNSVAIVVYEAWRQLGFCGSV